MFSYGLNLILRTVKCQLLSVALYLPYAIVPQGSILGPLLFITYVNGLPTCLKHCEVAIYADDTVIYYSGLSAQEITDALNSDLQELSSWFESNLLTLNASKSKFVLFGSNRSPKSYRNVQDLSIVIDADSLDTGRPRCCISIGWDSCV